MLQVCLESILVMIEDHGHLCSKSLGGDLGHGHRHSLGISDHVA